MPFYTMSTSNHLTETSRYDQLFIKMYHLKQAYIEYDHGSWHIQWPNVCGNVELLQAWPTLVPGTTVDVVVLVHYITATESMVYNPQQLQGNLVIVKLAIAIPLFHRSLQYQYYYFTDPYICFTTSCNSNTTISQNLAFARALFHKSLQFQYHYFTNPCICKHTISQILVIPIPLFHRSLHLQGYYFTTSCNSNTTISQILAFARALFHKSLQFQYHYFTDPCICKGIISHLAIPITLGYQFDPSIRWNIVVLRFHLIDGF